MPRPLGALVRWVAGWTLDRGLRGSAALPAGVRVTTYNIGRGAKGPRGATHATLDRVAASLAAEAPDVVGLQEVHEHDVPVLVTLLRREHGLRFHPAFAPALAADEVARVAARARARAEEAGGPFDAEHYRDRTSAYGLATLSREPLRAVEVVRLPGRGEARVVLRATTALGGVDVVVLTTHLATDRVREADGTPVRDLQARALLALARDVGGPVVVLGDLNQEPEQVAAAQRAVGAASLVRANDPDAPTLGGRVIDHVLVSPDLVVRGRRVGPAGASDHRPVTVALRPPRPGRGAGGAPPDR